MDPETTLELRAAFKAFDSDNSQSVPILTGADGVFCTGNDLKVAAGGHTAAGGLELALWYNLQVASATAVFGVYYRRWGAPLNDGGTIRLPRLISHNRALNNTLTSRGGEVTELSDIGLANRLDPAGKALPTATELALEIVKFSQRCLKADRRSCY